jgi:phosphoribosylanthranilate isomerase
MIVKICGMADAAQMHQLAKLQADMLGLVFYPLSPRYVVGKIEPGEIKTLPVSLKKTGVFVNETAERILKLAKEYYLNTIQLHGNETPAICETLKEEGLDVIKAFNLTKENNFDAYAPYCDYFLFDTPSEKHGGTGAKFDWSLLNTYTGKTPFLLSGGIGPGDAEEIKSINHPQFAGIDINSKFEIEPGVKDVEKVKKFLHRFPPNPLKTTPQPPKVGEKGKMFFGAEPILFEFAKKLRNNPTEAEDFLWKQLSEKEAMNWRFRRQHPVLYFIADFYCHKAKLIIEVDGGYHKIPEQYEYDSNRDYELEELGLKVLRFTNEQVLFDIENTLKTIEKTVKQRIYG